MGVVQKNLTMTFPRFVRKIDWVGIFLLLVSLGPILVVLALGGDQLEWGSPLALLMIFGGLGWECLIRALGAESSRTAAAYEAV